VFPDTKEQRCWFHLSANVLNCLPKFAQPGARAALAEIYNAEDRAHALKAVKAFEADYGVKWPKAAAKITDHATCFWSFTTTPPSTGFICARRTRSSRPSRPSGCSSGSRRALVRGLLASRWPSS
jgi:transposase-like protein